MPYRPATVHAALGPAFFDPVRPASFPRHVLRHRHQAASAEVGLDHLTDGEWIDHFGRFLPLPGSFAEPLALRYHGHQFRSYNPELGDGRGFLFAQLRDRDGRLLDLGTKGSGQTPYSRRGDGRLTLKGGVREVLATSFLEALGVNTSRSFSLIETGEALIRGDEPSPTRSSVLVRLSHSHIRIGTFQRLAYEQDIHSLAKLVAHVVEHYLPEAQADDGAERAARMLEATCRRVAAMGAQWMAAGFVHGVLNSDNINVTGESFDYGPWRFLPVFDPGFTAAYFDSYGLYAFGRQPGALAWNLERLAECLLPLAPAERLQEALESFQPAFLAALRDMVAWRLGVTPPDDGTGQALVDSLYLWLRESRAPFAAAFFHLRGGRTAWDRAADGPLAEALAHPSAAPLRRALEGCLPLPGARAHPYWRGAGPVTLLHPEVEALWAPIDARDDWSPFATMLDRIAEAGAAHGPPPWKVGSPEGVGPG